MWSALLSTTETPAVCKTPSVSWWLISSPPLQGDFQPNTRPSLGLTSFGLPRPVFPTGARGPYAVTQDKSAVSSEGQSAQLSCSYRRGERSIPCCQQVPGGSLQFVILRITGGWGQGDSFTRSLETTNRCSSLSFPSSQPGPSAVYSCALYECALRTKSTAACQGGGYVRA